MYRPYTAVLGFGFENLFLTFSTAYFLVSVLGNCSRRRLKRLLLVLYLLYPYSRASLSAFVPDTALPPPSLAAYRLHP